MSGTRATVLALAFLVAAPSAAFADATIFVGANTTPSSRVTRGLAIGMSMLIVGVEFEYSNTPDDKAAVAPSLKTGMASVFLQTPVEIARIQPYIGAGVGIYRERLEATGHQDTSGAVSTGGGIKVSLVGPLRLRLDYRVFRLGSGALNSPAHRIYAGLNLKF
jgi:opacity protein-like surface antigen